MSYGNNVGNNFIDTIVGHKNLHLFIRDQCSLDLLRAKFSFYNPPILVADLAHLCKENEESKDEELERWMELSNKKIVGINIHKDFGRYNGQVFDSIKNFILCKKHEYRFLLIPHDRRKQEKELLKELVKKMSGVDTYLSHHMDPEYEKKITKQLYFAITGRMHLSILTIPNGVPCIVIEYKGTKSLGTLSHWGISDLAIDPKNIDRLPEIIKKLESNYGDYVRTINQNHKKVMSLSKKQLTKIINIY